VDQSDYLAASSSSLGGSILKFLSGFRAPELRIAHVSRAPQYRRLLLDEQPMGKNVDSGLASWRPTAPAQWAGSIVARQAGGKRAFCAARLRIGERQLANKASTRALAELAELGRR